MTTMTQPNSRLGKLLRPIMEASRAAVAIHYAAPWETSARVTQRAGKTVRQPKHQTPSLRDIPAA